MSRQRLEQLRGILREHDRRYHELDAPTISDEEYDQLMTELKVLEAHHPGLADPSSPTQKVGAAPNALLGAVKHSAQLLSLDNVFDLAELEACGRLVEAELAAGREEIDDDVEHELNPAGC